jgi:hypothetical protein
VHPDTYGDEDLFVWCRHLQEYVTSDHIEESPSYVRRQPPRHHPPQTERLDFTSAYERFASHRDLTRHIVDVAQDYGEPYASVLLLLSDCYFAAPSEVMLSRQEAIGASYKQLAYVAHLAGMNSAQRTRFYRVAEELLLSQRHAGHLIGRLQQAA